MTSSWLSQGYRTQLEDEKASPGNQAGLFFFLTYVVTWASWLGAWAISDGGFARAGLWMLPFYLGVFAPGFVAVWLTFRGEGSAGVRALLSRLVQWEAGIRWYVFALTYMAAIKLAAALIHRLATGEWPLFGNEPLYLMLAATLGSMVVFGQSGEEVGWRGYALPRLAGRIGLGRASIVVGIMWASWHLPLFFVPGTGTTGQSFPIYMLGVIAISVAIAWLYQRTNGSLFLTMLMHSAINNTKDIVPSVGPVPTNPFAISATLIGWLTAGLMWLCAAYLLFRMKQKTAPDEGRE